jgi:hypothetical protein
MCAGEARMRGEGKKAGQEHKGVGVHNYMMRRSQVCCLETSIQEFEARDQDCNADHKNGLGQFKPCDDFSPQAYRQG